MTPALRDLLGSKKFLVLLGSGIVWIAALLGFQVDQAQIDKFLALVGVYIFGQGLADLGRGIGAGRGAVVVAASSSSEASPPPAAATPAKDPASVLGEILAKRPEGGFATPTLMLGLAAIAALLLSSASCGPAGKQVLGRIGGALLDGVMDCTTAEAKELIRNAGKPTDLSLQGVPDLETGMSELAKDSAADIFGCLLADAVTRAALPKPSDPKAPRSSPLEVDPKKLEAAWAATKASRFPGVRKFRTAHGDI